MCPQTLTDLPQLSVSLLNGGLKAATATVGAKS